GTLANITSSGAGSTTIASSTWITHTSSSYTGTDSNKWSFKWTAPSPGVGAVRFFANFNCGSGTNSGSGWIYFDSTHFKQASTVGIAQVTDANTNEITVYPNPVKDMFNVSYSLQESKQVDINVYTIDGKQVSTLSSAEQTAGDHNQSLRMPSVAPGIYLIQVIQGEQATYKKVVVE
ncbi:MAG TPA: T9SS type A sorting domain-containing protein, partial [Bacteroidia bacterium]|nr:T9SS type A sorting domain-containing protein [Bacteroidia bacterium]